MIYNILKILATLIFKIFFGFKVEGKENIPERPPYLIASNHVSYLDPIVIGCAFPHKVRFMAKKELFENKFLLWLLNQLGVFPVDRDALDISSVKKSIQILKDGGVLGIFPEGTRSKDGKFKGANKGVIGIAAKGGVPIVPVALKGTYEAWPAGQKILKFHEIIVKIGKPIYLFEIFSENGKIDYKKGAEILTLRIKELLEDEK